MIFLAQKKKKKIVDRYRYVGKKKVDDLKTREVIRREVEYENRRYDVDIEALVSLIYGGEKLLTIDEVAKNYGVTLKAVRSWVDRGHVPLFSLPSKLYIPKSKLKAYRGK